MYEGTCTTCGMTGARADYYSRFHSRSCPFYLDQRPKKPKQSRFPTRLKEIGISVAMDKEIRRIADAEGDQERRGTYAHVVRSLLFWGIAEYNRLGQLPQAHSATNKARAKSSGGET